MQNCIANSCLSFAWWGDLHGVVCRDSKSSMVGSAPTPWWLVSRPVCREGPTFTNFAPLPGIRLHSLNRILPALRVQQKSEKTFFCSPHRISLRNGDTKLKPTRTVLRQFRHKALNPSVWLLSFRIINPNHHPTLKILFLFSRFILSNRKIYP